MLSILTHIARATRSGLRRYPRALYASALGRPAVASGPGNGDLRGVADAELGATWLGHGTVLLRLGGQTVLLDPVFSDRIGMRLGGRTLGLERLMPVPVGLAGLPAIDIILITHAHFDHLDVPTLQVLASPRTRVITARRTGALIPQGFGQVMELDWAQRVQIGTLHIEAIRPRHWGSRTAWDRGRGFNSYVLRDPDGRGVLLTGDTAMTDAFDKIGDLALAAFGIGSYEPWRHAHATPEESWEMFMNAGAARLLPVHHSTFPLGDEPVDEPMQRLLAEAGNKAAKIIDPVPGRIWTP